MTAAWKKLGFILSVRSDFHMTDSLALAVHAFASRMLLSVSVDDTHCSQVGELVYKFQRATVYCGDVASLIKAYIFHLVCFNMETYTCSGSFQTM